MTNINTSTSMVPPVAPVLDVLGGRTTEKILRMIDDFIDTLPEISDLSDFVRFRADFDTWSGEVFAPELTEKPEGFRTAFLQSNILKYTDPDSTVETIQKRELRQLLVKKNELYQSVLLQLLQRSSLKHILTQQEVSDMIAILESRMLPAFDQLFVNWIECVTDENKALGLIPTTPGNPEYGGVQDEKIVGYEKFFDASMIQSHKLDMIQDTNIRGYLQSIDTLLKQGDHAYDAWVHAERFESANWKDQSTGLGFVSPMEDYFFPGVLVEPEIIFFLRSSEANFPYSDFYTLSEKFFGEKYGMDKMTCNQVETILEGGDSTFSGFIGKAFPNDQTLSDTEGNNIILKRSKMLEVVENAKKPMESLFPQNTLDYESLFGELMKEVSYHEFGHSLFIKGHPHSLLEETKATLFYHLRLWEENAKKPYSQEDMERVIYFTILDSTRNIERLHQDSSKKYVILTKIILRELSVSGCIRFEGDRITVQPDVEKFRACLTQLKDMLFWIQDLYGDELSREQKEDDFLQTVDQDILPLIDFMKKKILPV